MDAAQANVELVIPQERQKIGAHLRHGKKVCAEYVALLPTSEVSRLEEEWESLSSNGLPVVADKRGLPGQKLR